MRWTADNDQLLLAMILEIHSISVDGVGVAKIWPTRPGEDRPTARAISERVIKIRKIAGVGSATNAGTTKSTSKSTDKTTATGSATKSKKTTPPKKAKSKNDTPKATNKRKASGVRPNVEHSDHDHDHDHEQDEYADANEYPLQSISKKQKTTIIKREPIDDDTHDSVADKFAHPSAGTTPGNEGGEDGFGHELALDGIHRMLDDGEFDTDDESRVDMQGFDRFSSSS